MLEENLNYDFIGQIRLSIVKKGTQYFNETSFKKFQNVPPEEKLSYARAFSSPPTLEEARELLEEGYRNRIATEKMYEKENRVNPEHLSMVLD